ncbi:MAG TPA: GNAT family N-acetyltransferase [Sphingobium sp.]
MIRSDRLILRNWKDADSAPFATMCADVDVMEHLGGPIGRAESDVIAARISETAQKHGHCFWAIERENDGMFLGFCGLRRGGHPGTSVPDELEIGWRLSRSAWGQGYAREAAAAALEWGWRNTSASRIAAWTVPANLRSWGLMQRLGMVHRPDLDFDHPNFPDGHPLRRHLVYVIERP